MGVGFFVRALNLVWKWGCRRVGRRLPDLVIIYLGFLRIFLVILRNILGLMCPFKTAYLSMRSKSGIPLEVKFYSNDECECIIIKDIDHLSGDFFVLNGEEKLMESYCIREYSVKNFRVSSSGDHYYIPRGVLEEIWV